MEKICHSSFVPQHLCTMILGRQVRVHTRKYTCILEACDIVAGDKKSMEGIKKSRNQPFEAVISAIVVNLLAIVASDPLDF